jgi:Tol biopolymer transport system component
VERHGHLVEKDQLMKLVWPDSYVEETNLTHHISILRSTLAAGNTAGPFIETLPKRGYRFIAPTLLELEDSPQHGGVGNSSGSFQDRGTVNAAAPESSAQPVSQDPAANGIPRSSRRLLVPLIAACVSLIAVTVSVVLLIRPPTQFGSLVLQRLTYDTGLTADPVISRDGNMVAYASDRTGEDNVDIWVQQLAGGRPIRLTNHPTVDAQPDISPDGSRIVFRSERAGGGIYVIPALGGEERLVAIGGQLPRFSPDGLWIACSIGDSAGLAKVYIVPSTGGAPREVKTQVPWSKGPIWSPDGTRLMFLGSMDPLGFGGYDWWVAPAEGGQAIKTGAFAAFERSGRMATFDASRGLGQDALYSVVAYPRIWSGDRVIFSALLGDSANLWQVAIHPKTWWIKDAPLRLTAGSGQEFSPSLASNGRLVFATVKQHANLWTLPLDANGGYVTGDPAVLSSTDANSFRPSLSADGRSLVFVSDQSGNREIWLRDMETGKETALTNTPWPETHPYITADGSKVFYQSLEEPKAVIYMLSLAKRVPENLCDDCGLPLTGSPDGTRLFFHHRDGIVGRWRSIDLTTGERTDVIRHEKRNLHMLRLSPDGKWLAYRAQKLAEDPWFQARSYSVLELPTGQGLLIK